MRISLIADTFPPLRTSGAIQLRDLAREFLYQGHQLTVLLPSPDQQESWRLEHFEGVQVLRLRAPRTKNIGYARRALAELLMPFTMIWHYRKSPMANTSWDGVVWYSPSIFHGPFVNVLKNSSNCKAYLIIRDIFPEWTVEMGLLKRGLAYLILSMVAKYQYSVADVIGVQSPGNQPYLEYWHGKSGRRVEVLQNWLDEPPRAICSIRLNETTLAGRRVFVYAGNMGVAQGMDILLDLAEKLVFRTDIGFLMVGRGSESARLRIQAEQRNLSNMAFFDEVHPDEVYDLCSQCSAGIVLLDPRHKSHNIPGKFLAYMQSGLPVLAHINPGNDLANLIRVNKVGFVSESGNLTQLEKLALNLLDDLNADHAIRDRCRSLYLKRFMPRRAVFQIISALQV